MSNVFFFDKNNPSIGLRVRRTTLGPEIELLRDFLEMRSIQYERKKTSYAIFVEPQLATGFPDAVIVEYKEERLLAWNEARCNLTESDIKLLYYMIFVKKANDERILKQTGVSPSILLQGIGRLLDAELIIREKRQWAIAHDISQKIAISNLTAIEAKINNWAKVFEQAHSNFYFAKESYVLTPTKSPSQKTKERATGIGVGIYALASRKILEITPARKTKVWGSYTSLLFNEWVGRYAFGQ